MLLQEDFFNDIKDDDIKTNDDINEIPHSQLDVSSLEKQLMSNYSRSIIITTYGILSLYDSIYWKEEIPTMIKRVCNILDAYNIEYEYIIRDGSPANNGVLHFHQVGNFQIISSFDKESFFIKNYRTVNFIFYVNFPQFTYKESYKFIDRLRYVIQKSEGPDMNLFNNISITKDEPIPIVYFKETYSHQKNLHYHFGLASYDHDNKILWNNKFGYKSFLKVALKCFQHNIDDLDIIDQKLAELYNDKDPFATKT